MVNDDLVTAERTQGRQHGRGNGVAGIDVADDSTIFARVSVDNSVSTLLILGGGIEGNSRLVAGLEQPTAGSGWNLQ